MKLLLKVTTELHKWPKISKKKCIKSSLFARRAKKALAGGQSLPQELEVSPSSGLYFLVIIKKRNDLKAFFVKWDIVIGNKVIKKNYV